MRTFRCSLLAFILLLGALTEANAQFSWKPKPYPESRSFAVTEFQVSPLYKDSDFHLYGFGTQIESWRWKAGISFSSNYGVSHNSPHQKSDRQKPPLKFGKIMAQFGAGVIGGLLGNVIWVDQFENTKVKGDAGYNPTRHQMMLLSSFLGTSLGVYVIGNIGETHGSYWSTALGAFVGSLPLLAGIDDPYYWVGAFSFGLLLQTVGGIIGFNISREFDAARSPTALINMKNRQVSLGVPTIAASVNPPEGYPSLSYQINVIQFAFN